MRIISNTSLGTKTIFLFSLILIGVASLIYLSITSQNNIQFQYNKISDEYYENLINLEQLNGNIKNNLIMAEKFIANHDTKQYQVQAKNYIEIENFLTKIKEKFPSNLEEKFNILMAKLQSYNQELQFINKLIIDQSDSSTSIKGKLKATTNEINNFINESGLGDYYTIQLLTFMTREKDFIIKNDIKHFDELRADIKNLNQRMESKNLDSSRKNALTLLIKKYEIYFNELSKNIETINVHKNSYLQHVESINQDIKNLANNTRLGMIQYQKNVETIIRNEFVIYGIVSSFIILIVGIINFLAYRFSKSLSIDVVSLKSISEEFVASCDKISTSSDHLNKMATEQSSSIEETAASIKQISAMVSKNSESASQTQGLTDKNSIAAQNGMNTITEVLKAMDKLSDSSSSITSRFHKTSEELQGVVSIINQIGDKAKVINDIVFQTKLLSFNASVEAARAGEHGKGFSVVAEEIGNLATMSGTSAEEITKILDASIKKVTGIVADNQKDISNLVSENDSNLNYGKTTVKECEKSLKEIISNITHVSNSINEIATASKEQDSGVREISNAIASLSSTNQETVKYIQNSVGYTQSIEENTHQVFNMASHLEKILLGENKAKRSNHGTVEFFDIPSKNDSEAA